MKKQCHPLPFDERNRADFDAITRRLSTALETLRNDTRLKASESSLARLANCSRGTLRNRCWPLQKLKELKKERKEKNALPTASVMGDPTPDRQSEIAGLKRQLSLSRDEVARWKLRYDEVSEKLDYASEIIRLLKSAADSKSNPREKKEAKLDHLAGKVFPIRGKKSR